MIFILAINQGVVFQYQKDSIKLMTKLNQFNYNHAWLLE